MTEENEASASPLIRIRASSGCSMWNCWSLAMNSSSVTGSLSQAIVPSAVTVIVAVPDGSRGSPVSELGRTTWGPADLFSESVKRTKVASRKKMTSMRGMISIRALFLPPPPPPELEPAMLDRREAGSVRRRLGFLDQDLEGVGGVGHLLLRLLRAGVKVVEREEAGDGDSQPAHRGDEGLGDAADDAVGRRAHVAAGGPEGPERAHHPGDRAQEAEQRGRGDAGVEGRHALLVAGELLGRGSEEGVRQGVEVREAV